MKRKENQDSAETTYFRKAFLVLSEGQKVSVNWQGKTVWAEIIALNDDEGKLNFKDIEWCKGNLQETIIAIPDTHPDNMRL